jgi:cysteine sulfinate desulfinase/cysteine desulfurase-like protein
MREELLKMFKKIFAMMEDIIKSDVEMEKNAQHAAANIRQQAIQNCEQDILQAKFNYYGVGQPTKIK